MVRTIAKSFLPSSLRILTLLSKGVFSIALIRYINEDEYGLYVLMGVTVSFYQYLLGADFGYIAHRELLAGKVNFGALIGTQVGIISAGFVVVMFPVYYFFPIKINLSIYLGILFLLVFETATNEIQRHLILYGDNFQADLVMVSKSALWMFPLLFLMNVAQKQWAIWEVLVVWSLGLLGSFVYGCYRIKRFLLDRMAFDFGLLRSYMYSAPVVIIGTLAVRALLSVDKYYISGNIKEENVAMYGLYAGIASAFSGVVDSGILNREYSGIIKKSQENLLVFKSSRLSINKKIGLFIFVSVILYIAFIPAVLQILGKFDWVGFRRIGVWLIIGNGFYALSFVDNCYLYAHRVDALIATSNVIVLSLMLLVMTKVATTVEKVSVVVMLAMILNLLVKRGATVYLSKRARRFTNIDS